VLVETEYSTGARLGREEMEEAELQVARPLSAEEWFVSIPGRRKRRRAGWLLSDRKKEEPVSDLRR
jgi:hypothetical protein